MIQTNPFFNRNIYLNSTSSLCRKAMIPLVSLFSISEKCQSMEASIFSMFASAVTTTATSVVAPYVPETATNIFSGVSKFVIGPPKTYQGQFTDAYENRDIERLGKTVWDEVVKCQARAPLNQSRIVNPLCVEWDIAQSKWDFKNQNTIAAASEAKKYLQDHNLAILKLRYIDYCHNLIKERNEKIESIKGTVYPKTSNTDPGSTSITRMERICFAVKHLEPFLEKCDNNLMGALYNKTFEREGGWINRWNIHSDYVPKRKKYWGKDTPTKYESMNTPGIIQEIIDETKCSENGLVGNLYSYFGDLTALMEIYHATTTFVMFSEDQLKIKPECLGAVEYIDPSKISDYEKQLAAFYKAHPINKDDNTQMLLAVLPLENDLVNDFDQYLQYLERTELAKHIPLQNTQPTSPMVIRNNLNRSTHSRRGSTQSVSGPSTQVHTPNSFQSSSFTQIQGRSPEAPGGYDYGLDDGELYDQYEDYENYHEEKNITGSQ